MAQEAFDLAERFQTPGVRDERSRPRHEQLDVRAVRLSREAARSRQGARRRDAEAARRLGPLQGRRRRRHSVPDAARHGMPAYFTRGSGHNEKAQYSERPDDYVDNMDRLARKFDTARTRVPAPRSTTNGRRQDRHHRLRHVALGDRREPRSAAGRDGLETSLPAAAGVSVHRRSRRVHRRATTASTSSSRTATRRCSA